MSSSEVSTVLPVGRISPPASVVRPSPAASTARVENPDISYVSDRADISVIASSETSAVSEVAESGSDKVKGEGSGEEHATAIEAEQAVQNLKQALENIKATKIAFNVDRIRDDKIAMSFQVVDAESGEVVREFPPEIEKSLSHRTEEASLKGLLVDDDF